MLSMGEDDLICDFAETYQIYNWESLDLPLAATLAAGLPDSSRIKRKISGMKLTLDQTLEAHIADALHLLIWMQSKDGHKGRNKPESLLEKLLGRNKKKKEELMTFDTPDDYDEWNRKKEEEWRRTHNV